MRFAQRLGRKITPERYLKNRLITGLADPHIQALIGNKERITAFTISDRLLLGCPIYPRTYHLDSHSSQLGYIYAYMLGRLNV
ncbi:hypothetical protein [Nostoc sp.]|uniref:hypothetical protein n=1 Tax=Nostoc sp. TaxID=1180 RepID=UPI002FFCCFE1